MPLLDVVLHVRAVAEDRDRRDQADDDGDEHDDSRRCCGPGSSSAARALRAVGVAVQPVPRRTASSVSAPASYAATKPRRRPCSQRGTQERDDEPDQRREVPNGDEAMAVAHRRREAVAGGESVAQNPSSATRQGAMIASVMPWITRLSAGATVARIPPSRVFVADDEVVRAQPHAAVHLRIAFSETPRNGTRTRRPLWKRCRMYGVSSRTTLARRAAPSRHSSRVRSFATLTPLRTPRQLAEARRLEDVVALALAEVFELRPVVDRRAVGGQVDDRRLRRERARIDDPRAREDPEQPFVDGRAELGAPQRTQPGMVEQRERQPSLRGALSPAA